MKTDALNTVLILLLLCGGVAMLQAQRVQQPLVSALVTPSAPTSASGDTGSSHPEFQQRYPRYEIQREDVLALSFPLSPELNQTVTVQPDGFINLQSAGALRVQGMTIPQMIDALKKAYAGVLHDPIINVDLKDFQKPFFTASGQVGRPGKYDLRSDITVAEALAIAGGMTPAAKTQIFLFHRTLNNWYEVEKINMKEILKGKKVSEDATLRPGDMIYVPEKFIDNFKKYVPYSVNGGTYLQPSPF